MCPQRCMHIVTPFSIGVLACVPFSAIIPHAWVHQWLEYLCFLDPMVLWAPKLWLSSMFSIETLLCTNLQQYLLLAKQLDPLRLWLMDDHALRLDSVSARSAIQMLFHLWRMLFDCRPKDSYTFSKSLIYVFRLTPKCQYWCTSILIWTLEVCNEILSRSLISRNYNTLYMATKMVNTFMLLVAFPADLQNRLYTMFCFSMTFEIVYLPRQIFSNHIPGSTFY